MPGDNLSKPFFHLEKLDWILILSVLLLVGIGLVSIYSTSIRREDFSNFRKQTLFFGAGFFLMLAASSLDWRILRDSPYLILSLYFLGILALLGLLFFAPTIREVKGWYKLGPLSIDPIEPFKIILIILFAKYFSKRHVEMYDIRHVLVSGIYVLIPAFLIFLQPDLGSVLILFFLWGAILSICGIKTRHLLILVLCALLVTAFGWKYFLREYQRERIISFIAPQVEPLGMSWSQIQAKIAIGSGGIFGKGFASGSQAQYGFLTEPQTDFIFSAIAEEFGFVGVFLVLVLFSILFFRLMRVAFLSSSNFPRLFVSGFAFLLMCQVFIHIGMNLGILPIIGIPLPLVSYGGSSLISFFLALGISQSIKIRQATLSSKD